MIYLKKITILVVILLVSLTINTSVPLYALEDSSEIATNSISQKAFSSPISKNSSTYKVLVGLSIVAIVIAMFTMMSFILSILAYFFIIGSFGLCIYSILPLFLGKGLTQTNYTYLGLGILFTIVSFVVFRIINGKPIGSSMKSEKDESSSKNEFNLLLKRTKLAFMILKNEISSGKLDKATVFLGDELLEQLNINLESMKTENYKINYEDLRIKKIDVKKKAVENHMNNIYIEVVATALRYKTDLKTKSIIEGSQKKDDFVEILCFSRKAGCKAATRGLIEGVCPRCGNPLKGKRTDVCSKCKNELRSGDFDVVLTGISYPD